jgi:peroxiredoxin
MLTSAIQGVLTPERRAGLDRYKETIIAAARPTMTKPALIFCLVSALFLLALWLSPGGAEAISPLKQVKGEVVAGEFALPDLDGKSVRLSSFKGKVVLLNFWATWCSTCEKERPVIERLWQTYRSRGFVVLAVSVDRSSTATVRRYVERHGLSFLHLHDRDDRVSPDYWVMGIPTSVLITTEGLLAYRVVGEYDWNGPEVRQAIERLLKETAR